MELVLIALGPVLLILAGCVLLSVLWWVRREVRGGAAERLWSVGVALAWVLFLVGTFAALAIMTQMLTPIAWLAATVVIFMAIKRYRDSERQSLLWYLTIGAERGIPLDSAARAFAAEREGLAGKRARNLAEYLEAGVPLALALKRSRHSLPTTAVLAADMGQSTDNLGEALRRAADQIDADEAMMPSVLEAMFYFGFVALTGVCVVVFMMLRIVPMMSLMFDEFGLALPRLTQAVIWIAEWMVASGVLFLPLLAILIVSAAGLLHHAGFSLRYIPGIGLLRWRSDCALVMRWLATAVRHERSITETIRLMASYFPRPAMRRKLEQAAMRVENGANWCDSLWRCRLIRRADSVVFKSAERAGNLAWALDEMAESSLRRATYRLRAFLNVAFPTVVIVIGLGVLFLTAGLLMPLFSLIVGLS